MEIFFRYVVAYPTQCQYHFLQYRKIELYGFQSSKTNLHLHIDFSLTVHTVLTYIEVQLLTNLYSLSCIHEATCSTSCLAV